MSDKLTGPAPTGPVSGAERAAGAPPVVRPPPLQAVIVGRPPDLAGAGPTTVTGILGTTTPDGLMPLATAFGTLMLRAVPGAWPAELRPGNELMLTIGPGNRAGAVLVRGEGAERALATPAAATPVSARAIGAVEAGLRGMLMPPRPDTAGLAQAAQVVTTSQRQSQPGQGTAVAAPNAPGPAQAPATSPGLLAAAAAAHPRALTPPAAPLTAGEGPRLDAAVQIAAAVSGARPTAGTGAGDLMRDAALRIGGTAGQGLTAAPALASRLPGAEDPPDPPRSDQQSLAAFAHPGMMARMAALLPRGDASGGLALMLYLLGVRTGGARLWIGEEGLSQLTRGEAAALEKLDGQMVQGRRLGQDGRTWTTVLIPWLEGEELSAILLSTAARPAPVDPDEEGGGAAEGRGRTPPQFVVGLHLSELGDVQLRGRLLDGGIRMTLTLAAEPDESVRAAFETVLKAALPAAEGHVSLRWGVLPDLPELMPSAGPSTHQLVI